jgi:hypothetical protein
MFAHTALHQVGQLKAINDDPSESIVHVTQDSSSSLDQSTLVRELMDVAVDDDGAAYNNSANKNNKPEA